MSSRTNASLTRRGFLGGLGMMGLATALAGCSSQDSQKAVQGATSDEGADSSSESQGSARSVDDIKAAGTVNIGTFSDKAPFGYVDADGTYQGYDIVFAHRLADDLGVKINFIATDGQNRVPYLESNKADIMLANFTVTDERAEKVDFTLPYMKVQLGVVSPESAPITSVDQLDGQKLIVAKGTTAQTYFSKHYPNIQLVEFDAYADAYNALLRGDGVAFSTDNTEVLAWAKVNPGYVVGIDDLGDTDTIAGAVHKGNESLLQFINDEITGPLAEEGFFHKAYEETLRPVYGDEVDPDTIVVEGGKL